VPQKLEKPKNRSEDRQLQENGQEKGRRARGLALRYSSTGLKAGHSKDGARGCPAGNGAV